MTDLLAYGAAAYGAAVASAIAWRLVSARTVRAAALARLAAWAAAFGGAAALVTLWLGGVPALTWLGAGALASSSGAALVFTAQVQRNSGVMNGGRR